jgi:ferredoxin
MSYLEDELNVYNIPDFPADRNLEVCAAGALIRPNGVGAPVVNVDDCIGCGVCATRCSVGAIHLAPYAVVTDDINVAFMETQDQHESETHKVRAMFEALSPTGHMLIESDQIVDGMQIRLDRATRRLGDQFPNHLVRNLFLSIGIGAAMRRRGDNAVRMDLILGQPGTEFGVAEVEFGGDAVLDSPRDVLDDVAILVSRRGWPLPKITALIVSDVLPNKRSEYWEIIQDIHKVLNVKVGTITVLALTLLVWNRKKLAMTSNNVFYTDKFTDSYRASVLEPMLGRPLKLSANLRPHVEVAK